MLRRLLVAAVLALSTVLTACTPAQLAGLKTANTIAAGVACGIAAANETPCTPQETLAELAKAQKEIVELLAKNAEEEGTDPAVLAAILESLEANAAAQRALAEQVIKLAEKTSAAPAPAPQPSSPPAPSTPPPTTPPPVPVAPEPPPSAPFPPPAAPAPTSKPPTA